MRGHSGVKILEVIQGAINMRGHSGGIDMRGDLIVNESERSSGGNK